MLVCRREGGSKEQFEYCMPVMCGIMGNVYIHATWRIWRPCVCGVFPLLCSSFVRVEKLQSDAFIHLSEKKSTYIQTYVKPSVRLFQS